VQHDAAIPVASAFVTARSDSPARALDDVFPASAPARSQAAAPVLIEYASRARLIEIETDWLALGERALDPNVFMDPAIIRSAERAFPDTRRATLLAWQADENVVRLVGLWSLSFGRVARSPLLGSVLVAPATPHAYLATPVIDREAPDRVLAAMLDYLERDAGMPNIIMLDAMALSGETMASLSRVLKARHSAPFILARAQRPMLESGLDAKQYLEKSQSSSSRKKLRQHRRRLEEKGRLESKVCKEPGAVGQAFDDFIRLENRGWKGRQGTALLCDSAEAAFSAAMVADLAGRGDAWIHALYLDDKPISMQIVLRAGRVGFTWKTAYDEDFQDFSPGMLLLEDYTREFLADRSISSINSCAYDDKSFMSVWAERQDIGQVCVSARRGPSLRFFLICRLRQAFLKMRSAAKMLHASWGRKWKKA